MEGLHGISHASIDALKSVFVGLATITVSLRLIANWKYNSYFLVDDYISICAIPLLIAVSVLSDLAGNGFHDPTASAYKIAELAVGIAVITPLALWTCKAPILFSYRRVFNVKRWLRITSVFTLVIMAVVYIACIIIVPIACMPHTDELSRDFIDGCQSRTRMVNLYLGVVSLLADVLILVLPMPVLFGLKLMVPSKIGLLFLFMGGLLAIAASIISLYFKAASFSAPETSLAISILATITESSIALMVGCVPSLRVLWSKILKPGARSVSESNGVSTAQPTCEIERPSSAYLRVEEGLDEKNWDSNNRFVESIDDSSSRLSFRDLPQQPVRQQEPRTPVTSQDIPRLQAYYQPGREKFYGSSPPSFGVYGKYSAQQPNNQRGWVQ